MLKLVLFSTVQSLFLALTQVFLKFGLERMSPFGFNWRFFKSALFNLPFAASGICVAAASLIWFYIVKHFELSVAYPMISISYVFGMLASVFIFHEQVSVLRWIGVGFIMTGVVFLTK
ncbi:MAG: EamA family transporter [Bacteroidales bacterium]|jgi:undecaprenyl phosphate-alpha-L-ara4N flippase subunit ArnE|nr:EamA family transporter [Bacteroidales bacterium]